jgi:hypothetical protein
MSAAQRSNVNELSRGSSVIAASRLRKHASRRQRVADRAVEVGLGAKVMNVVQCQRGHHSIGDRERTEEASLAERGPFPERGKPPPGLVEHRAVHVEHRDARLRQPVEHRCRQRAGPSAEVKHVRVRGRQRRKQLHAGGQHLVVLRDKPPDLNVVSVGVDVEMMLDRMGHPATVSPGFDLATSRD